jgi:glycosyltransferase involved in cell wall biosynthesis
MEAAARGCPIVARDAPGVRETLAVGYEGLTPHDSPEAMAATIDAWIDDPRATARRAQLLQEQMYLRFAGARVAEEWERLFRR